MGLGSIATNAQASINTHRAIALTISNGGDTGREIIEEQDVVPGNGPFTRGVIPQPAYAYIDNNVITVAFQESFSSATVTITNETTGEAVYSETYNNPATLNIDLNGKSSGTYLIQIEADDTYLEGNFAL
ncbi:DUF3244 domain-containing protein [Bacteroides sp. GD17]